MQEKFNKVSIKVIILIATALGLFLLYHNKGFFLSLLEQSPTLWALFKHITYQIEEQTLLGLFYANAFGSLFFITIPAEVVFIYYTFLSYHPLLILAISIVGTMLGILADYIIGWLFGERVLRYFLKEHFEKLSKLNERFGGLLILLGHISIIFPFQIYSAIVGATKYPIKRFIIYTFFGVLIKYGILLFGKNYVIETVIPWIRSVF